MNMVDEDRFAFVPDFLPVFFKDESEKEILEDMNSEQLFGLFGSPYFKGWCLCEV